jgi:phosphoribosylglycinamide formyltransferase-1
MAFFTLAIFASGNGSNAIKIIEYFESRKSNFAISFVLTNKPNAPVLDKLPSYSVPSIVCSNVDIDNPSFLLDICQSNDISHIILAGFLRKIPDLLIANYSNRIFNIHPSLLPKYGGFGMYGMHVHNAVKENMEKETGITIHYVSNEYDTGNSIAQFYTSISEYDSAEDIALKVHALEHTYFSLVIEQELMKQLVFNSNGG